MKVASQLSKLAIGVAVVAAAGFAGTMAAQADGMPTRGRVVYERPVDWGGFYFGVHSGWAWSDIDSNFTTAAGVPTGANDSVQHDASAVGGQIGLQHQFGNIVLGVEGTLTTTFRDGYANVSCPNAARTCGKRFDDVLTVGPRLGYAMGHWMPYVTGGYANAAFSHESFDNGTVGNVLLGQERFGGWYIGGGFDMALSHGWTIGLEYRHYEFDTSTLSTHTTAGVGPVEFRAVDPSLDTLLLRVSWKLGRPDRVVPLK
jgi:outer membrane immunogenic protein